MWWGKITNVLLNLYRYQTGTRDELLKVLEKFNNKIWIPHHVALEFQRNRLKIIAEQNNLFSEVIETTKNIPVKLIGELEKLQLQKRHSRINPRSLIDGIERLVVEFSNQVNDLQKEQQQISAPDPLLVKIENLFDGRVGAAPVNQEEVEKLYKEAEERYTSKIPPGYKDFDKGKNEVCNYTHGGIIYKSKYGDYLIWKQILSHAKSIDLRSLIFITDDGKEDWWWKLSSNGLKTIGPRPELIEEARLSASVDNFLMYNPEGFLKYAKEFLQAKVSDETLKEVRDISIARNVRQLGPVLENFRDRAERVQAERAAIDFLANRFKRFKRNSKGFFPQFIAESNSEIIGIEIKMVRNPLIARVLLSGIFRKIQKEAEKNRFSEIVLVLLSNTVIEFEKTQLMVMNVLNQGLQINLRVIMGILEKPRNGKALFIPCDELIYSSKGNLPT